MFSIAGLVVASFVATNIDNLVLLIAYLLSPMAKSRQVFLGYFTGTCLLLLLAIFSGQISVFVPVEYLGLFGVVPIILGLKALYNIKFRTESDAGNAIGAVSISSVASAQLAYGTDTILVFSPLLADSQQFFDYEIAVVFLLAAALWYQLAKFLSSHAARLPFIEKIGMWIAPIVMIVVGMYILNNTTTDLLAGS